MSGLRLLTSFAVCFAPLVLAGFAAADPVIVSEQYDFRSDDGRSTGGAWTPSHTGNSSIASDWRGLGFRNGWASKRRPWNGRHRRGNRIAD